MNKRKYDQIQTDSGFVDRKDAERMCQRKLKRLSSSTLYKKVLVKNTLKFVQSRQNQEILLQTEGDYEPISKVKYDEDDLVQDVSEILNEMIFPHSLILPSPEDLDWPEALEQNDVAIVPDVEIIEEEVDQHFLSTIFSDRTNVTITKLSKGGGAKEDSKDSYSHRISSAKLSPPVEPKMIKPEISLIPARSLKILEFDDFDKY